MRRLLALQLLAPFLRLLAVAEEAPVWHLASHAASCASDVSGGAVAGGGFAGMVALMLGTPVTSMAAGGLLLGSVAGGLLLDGCQNSDATGGSPSRGPVFNRTQTMQPALPHTRLGKANAVLVVPGRVREKTLDAFLQRVLPRDTMTDSASQDQHCNSKGSCMVKKYQKRWPNCNNLRCFTGLTLEDAQNVCLSHPVCNGFSISSRTSGEERGSGCYKMTCKDEGWNGYATGQDDYWAKMVHQDGTEKARSPPRALVSLDAGEHQECDRRGVCITKRYEKRWPNCVNLKCFSNVVLQDAKASCLANSACHGFSISAGIVDKGPGSGCYKTSCEEDSWNGYVTGQDDYWAKGAVQSKGTNVLAFTEESPTRRCHGHGACMLRKYARKWPNCENLKCFRDIDLQDARTECLSNPRCDGFSMSERAMEGGRGNGCYKTKCTDDSWNGYAYGSDGYWAKAAPAANKVSQLVPQVLATVKAGLVCKPHGTCMKKKYIGKWPNCRNIRCFSGITVEAATMECLSNPSCNGLSISGGIIVGLANGCYKTSCEEDAWNGYESGQDDYWAKVSAKASKVESSNHVSLLGLQGGCDGHGVCMEKKYKKKWPNCINLFCFRNTDVEDAKATCLSHPACSGFSMSETAMDVGRGDGCYKTTCENDSWNGFDVGSDGYWAKVRKHLETASKQVQTPLRCDPKGSCIVKKYERKNPNCENLECFANVDLEEAKAACLAHEACNGFSMSIMAMDGGKGDGCYKAKCKEEGRNGYEFGQDGYWAKVPHGQMAKIGQATKQEHALDVLLQKKIVAASVHTNSARPFAVPGFLQSSEA